MLVTASRVFVASDFFTFSLAFNFFLSLSHTCTDETDSQGKILPIPSYAMLAFAASYFSQSGHRYLYLTPQPKWKRPHLCQYCIFLSFFFQTQHNWMKPPGFTYKRRKRTNPLKGGCFLFQNICNIVLSLTEWKKASRWQCRTKGLLGTAQLNSPASSSWCKLHTAPSHNLHCLCYNTFTSPWSC